jgi:hypothetical protein
MKSLPIARGFGFGSILASAAARNLSNLGWAKLKDDTPHSKEDRAAGRLAPSELHLSAREFFSLM